MKRLGRQLAITWIFLAGIDSISKSRIRDWKLRLADAERRYQALENERNKILMKFGMPGAALPGDRAKVIELEGKMKSIQKEIDDARNMINVVIPDEARKAGIPPGWLRE